jgi:hypothetical protein
MPRHDVVPAEEGPGELERAVTISSPETHAYKEGQLLRLALAAAETAEG